MFTRMLKLPEEERAGFDLSSRSTPIPITPIDDPHDPNAPLRPAFETERRPTDAHTARPLEIATRRIWRILRTI
jgi:hypothetical protein